MKSLTDKIYHFAGELTLFTHELEDHFESPELKQKLKYIRKQLKDFKSYKPADMGESEKEKDQNHATMYEIQLDCERALDALSEMSEKSNVFDIIEALRYVYNAITTVLTDDVSPYMQYDIEDIMEAERVEKELSRVLFDDEDETEYLSYDGGISAKGEAWHEDNC